MNTVWLTYVCHYNIRAECVCVCVREREREREVGDKVTTSVWEVH